MLSARITRAPVPFHQDRAEDILAVLDPDLCSGELGALLGGIGGSSPYLSRLITRHAAWLPEAASQPPEKTLDTLLQALSTDIDEANDGNTVRATLRLAKSQSALLIALADLGGACDVTEVIQAMTRLADTCATAAARWLLRLELQQGKLPGLGIEALNDGAGYILLAMGKMGAHELNYSSDIDLIALFDDDRFEGADVLDARARYIHVTRQLVKLLSENTAQGYVFRTDLRLRPSPSTTPVCMAIDAAERYYESVGRTWERAAHIKARPLVDVAAGQGYLTSLTPFIWRRHLDFAAIEDTQEMLRKIRAQKTRFSVGNLPGYDLKLGPGGIREIEFFAQTRQLIMGGRDPSLRSRGTLDALAALTKASQITAGVRDTLTEDYCALRTIEHRLQMMEDAQTHSIPKSPEARAQLAALCGSDDVAAFDRDLAERLERVHETCDELFGSDTPTPRPAQQADTAEDALAAAGFTRAGDAMRQLQRWREGGIAATRSERARNLFAKLEPQIVKRLSGAADPDQALAHFDRFLSTLPAGVQVFALFSANPKLLDLIVEICAAAPKLAAYLGRHSQTLDALLDQSFWQSLPGPEVLRTDLEQRLSEAVDYEDCLNIVRRWAREHWFQAGVHVLQNISGAAEAGQAFTAIAEAYIAGLLPHVVADFATRHGPPPGNGIAVLAMGKLGSEEMTAGSDLDLITVYDGAEVEMSEGRRPLAPRTYYPRLTQSLVAALTAPTAEGALYEVDMRLRPSGSQGPVSVSLASFERYQLEEAWVWEHMALTRARVIAGPEALRPPIESVMSRALASRVGKPEIKVEAQEMRGRIVQSTMADRGKTWSLKHAEGGLMEIEFLVQTGVLSKGLARAQATSKALEQLAELDWLADGEAGDLGQALELQQLLQQIERVALDAQIDPDTVGAELRQVIARAAGVESFADVSEKLAQLQGAAARIVAEKLPSLA